MRAAAPAKRKAYPGGAASGLRYTDAVLTRTQTRGAGAAARYEIAISSEAIVERNFFGLAWREQLSHDAAAVQLSRFRSGRAPFLADHETGQQIGTLKNARIDGDGVLRADVAWGVGALAQEKKAEIDAGTGVGANVSVGYIPKRWKLVEEDTELGDLWLASLWEPVEASSVAVPADASVGFGRGHNGPGIYPVETEEREGIQVGITNDAPPRNREAELLEIGELCEGYSVPMKREWVEKKLTPDQVARAILSERSTRGTTAPSSEIPDMFEGLSTRDRDGYSFARAMLVAAGEAEGGVEAEVHAALSKAFPSARKGSGHSIMTPMRLSAPRWTRGALDTKTPTGASEMIFDRPGELIELFRNQSMVIRAGARVLTGLVGNVQFVKQTGPTTIYWVPENPGVDVTESEITTGLVTGSPKTMQGTTVYSRQFLVQAPSSGIDGENMVREDLALGHALAFDFAALHGKGAMGEPTGIYVSGDVLETATMGIPDWPKLVNMSGQIADANAPTDRLKWMTTPLMASKLKTVLVASASSSDFIWTGPFTNGEVAGYPSMATNQVRKNMGVGADEHGIVLADWVQVLLMTWNALELIVDPYAKKKQGLIEVTSFQMGDVVLRQPTAIVRAKGAKIA